MNDKMIHRYDLFGKYRIPIERASEYEEQLIIAETSEDDYYIIIDEAMLRPVLPRPYKSVNNQLIYREHDGSYKVVNPKVEEVRFPTSSLALQYAKHNKHWATRPVYIGDTITLKLDRFDAEYLLNSLANDNYLRRMVTLKRGKK